MILQFESGSNLLRHKEHCAWPPLRYLQRMIYRYEDAVPHLPPCGYVADSAIVIGKVHLKHETGIWFGAVLRGDIERIEVGEGSNIQDNCVVHTSRNHPALIGRNTSVGHSVVLHGCTVGNNCLIGAGAILLNGCRIGDNCIIGAGTLVKQNQQIPAHSLAVGNPARILRTVSEQEAAETLDIGRRYINRYKRYQAGALQAVISDQIDPL